MPVINTRSAYSSEQVWLHQSQGNALANEVIEYAGSGTEKEVNVTRRMYSGLLAVATLAMLEASKDLEPRVRG